MTQITSHVLDTSVGKPAAGIDISLFSIAEGESVLLGAALTDADGRVSDLCGGSASKALAAGDYKLVFDLQEYFDATNTDAFYPYVEIVFRIAGDGQHYHVPLLLNPYGYSTYRGS